ncbi:Ig-like domain-containing protein [Schaalia sp. JY-X169]|uniref:DUF7507 domain-containing protein n=1 Tax=Schaalia sp. JY-X169 TaxID=2758572 RepID=UPI0015F461F2|nr:Ig-like domain-containing protein [Schaalia sp. JY-X169]
MSNENHRPPILARAVTAASVLIIALSAATTASAISPPYSEGGASGESSGPSQQVAPEEAPESADDVPGAISQPVEAPREHKDDPTHSDAITEQDPDTGQEIVTRSGITHWEERSTPDPRLMSRATAPDILTVSIAPTSGSVGSIPNPRIRIDFSVPLGAKVGDSYDVDLSAPWIYATTSTTEIKDAVGTVFAVAQPKNFEQKGKLGRWRLTITLTEQVETHSNVKGFIDLQLAYYLNRSAFSGPIIATSNGVELARTAGNWSIPASGQQLEGAALNGGAFVNGKPAVQPGIRINYNRIPASGWKVTISNLSAGLSPSCNGQVQVQTADTNGWLIDTAGMAQVDTCTASTQVFTITQSMAQALGASGTMPVNLRTYMYGEKQRTSYSLRMTSNVPVNGASSWDLTAATGEGSASSADYLSLTTSKTAEVNSSSRNDSAAIGDTISYTITTTPGKDNDRAISNVITTDHLPEGLKFISANNNGTFDAAKRTVTWGPRFLSSTGRFIDVVNVEVMSTQNAGSLTNRVSNAGDRVCGEADAQSVCSAEVTTPLAKPSFAFTKASEAVDSNGNGWKGDEGDNIKYTFTAKNTGEVPLSSAKLTDKMLGISDRECLVAPLAPGASTQCVGEFFHTITKKDVDAGKVTNQATLCVDPKLGLACEDESTTTTTIGPAFSFSKSVATITDANGKQIETGKASKGDKILFQFEVTNTGNVDLTSAFVTDPLLGVSKVPCLSASAPLKPAQKVTCPTHPKFTYVVNDGDVAAGKVRNVAVGSVPGLPDQERETSTPVLPDPLSPNLPQTGATGSIALFSLGGILIAVGASTVALQYRYSSRQPLHRRGTPSH